MVRSTTGAVCLSGIHEFTEKPLTRYSDRVLLHLLRLRSSLQSHPQATEALDMVALDYGCMGNGDDFDGHRTRLRRPLDSTHLSWCY